MSETRNHPKPDHVDPFDLPESPPDDAAQAGVEPPAARPRMPRQVEEKRRHAG